MEKKTVAKAAKTKDLIALTAKKFNEFVNSGALRIPKDYSPDTALKVAGMVLADVVDKNGQKALEVCTHESIGNSLMKMVTLGLNPMRHCHFIMYGKKLTCDENYQAKVMIAKRDGGVKNIVAHAINEGDKFDLHIDGMSGVMSIKKHEKGLSSFSKPVTGAYCIVHFQDGSYQTTVMNIDQIKKSWAQRRGQPMSDAHKNFPDEMAKKTVISRALKPILKSLDDRALFHEDNEPKDKQVEDLKNDIEEIEYQDFEEVTTEEVVVEDSKQVDPEPEKETKQPIIEVKEKEDDPF